MKTWSRPSCSPLSPELGGGSGTSAPCLVDAHVHVFAPDFIDERQSYRGIDARFDALYGSSDARMATADEVLVAMDECGVSLSVVFGFAFSDIELCRQSNDYVLEAVRSNPGRLAGLACVPYGSTAAATELERCLENGMRGCGELAPVSGDPDEIASLAPIAGVLRERGLPLLVHASEPVGHEYPGKGRFTPQACVALAQAYPGLKIVLSHLGGGAFVYELMPEVREIMTDVLYDTAAIPYLYSPDVYEVAALVVGAEKLVFGSDFPLLDPRRCANGLERLSTGDQDAVRSGNARRIFRL